jgi:hypothetical protein
MGATVVFMGMLGIAGCAMGAIGAGGGAMGIGAAGAAGIGAGIAACINSAEDAKIPLGRLIPAI